MRPETVFRPIMNLIGNVINCFEIIIPLFIFFFITFFHFVCFPDGRYELAGRMSLPCQGFIKDFEGNFFLFCAMSTTKNCLLNLLLNLGITVWLQLTCGIFFLNFIIGGCLTSSHFIFFIYFFENFGTLMVVELGCPEYFGRLSTWLDSE